MKERHCFLDKRDCEEEDDNGILGIGDLCSGATRLFLFIVVHRVGS